MANVRIKLNSAGIRALMKSSEMAAVVESEAAKMTKATGVPYYHDVYVGRTRVNAMGQTNGRSFKTHATKGSSRKKQGSWVTIDGQKRYIKGYKRKK